MNSLGYVQIVDLSAAVGLGDDTSDASDEYGGVPKGAREARVVAEGGDVRWRDDGEDPTADAGMPLAAGETFVYAGHLRRIRFIAEDGSGGAKLNVTFYGADTGAAPEPPAASRRGPYRW